MHEEDESFTKSEISLRHCHSLPTSQSSNLNWFGRTLVATKTEKKFVDPQVDRLYRLDRSHIKAQSSQDKSWRVVDHWVLLFFSLVLLLQNSARGVVLQGFGDGKIFGQLHVIDFGGVLLSWKEGKEVI